MSQGGGRSQAASGAGALHGGTGREAGEPARGARRANRLTCVRGACAPPGRMDSTDRESFHAFSVRSVVEVVAMLRSGGGASLRSLEIELSMVPLSTAVTKLQLPPEAARRLQKQHLERCQCLLINSLLPWSRGRGRVLEGDVLLGAPHPPRAAPRVRGRSRLCSPALALAPPAHTSWRRPAVEDTPVVTFRDVELAVGDKHEVRLQLLRNGETVSEQVPSCPLDGMGTHQVLIWQGLVLQPAHRAVAQLGFMPFEGGGVYIAYFFFGSPAHRWVQRAVPVPRRWWLETLIACLLFSLPPPPPLPSTTHHGHPRRTRPGRYNITPKMWIKEVDGQPTPTLADFIKASADLHHGKAVRLRTIDLQAREAAYTLKIDSHFWRSRHFEITDGDWVETLDQVRDS